MLGYCDIMLNANLLLGIYVKSVPLLSLDSHIHHCTVLPDAAVPQL